jgi:hypothetical protein
MAIPPYEQRKNHYQSSYWQDLRAQARIRAGGQCERRIPSCDAPDGGSLHNRCDATTNLQLHHLHYDTFGQETLADVLLVCDDCHKTLEVMELCCDACPNPLFDNESDARYFIEHSEWYKIVYGTGLHSAARKDAELLCNACKNRASRL